MLVLPRYTVPNPILSLLMIVMVADEGSDMAAEQLGILRSCNEQEGVGASQTKAKLRLSFDFTDFLSEEKYAYA